MKRKATRKKIGKVSVVTNPKFTMDEETELDGTLCRALLGIGHAILQYGIAISRARATKSGEKRAKK